MYEVVHDENRDPFEKCIGIITLHDVIEALVQFDIHNEFEYHERSKYIGDYLKVMLQNYMEKKTLMAQSKDISRNVNNNEINLLNPQTKLVIFQILSSEIFKKIGFNDNFLIFLFCNIKATEPFKDCFIESSVLQQVLIDESNLVRVKIPNNVPMDEKQHYVYKYNKACNYFVLLVEGEMLLQVGKEKTEFIVKPFEYFGIQALMGEAKTLKEVLENKPAYKHYSPEFSLIINYKDNVNRDSKKRFTVVSYLKIHRNVWLNAVKTTELKRSTFTKANNTSDIATSEV